MLSRLAEPAGSDRQRRLRDQRRRARGRRVDGRRRSESTRSSGTASTARRTRSGHSRPASGDFSEADRGRRRGRRRRQHARRQLRRRSGSSPRTGAGSRTSARASGGEFGTTRGRGHHARRDEDARAGQRRQRPSGDDRLVPVQQPQRRRHQARPQRVFRPGRSILGAASTAAVREPDGLRRRSRRLQGRQTRPAGRTTCAPRTAPSSRSPACSGTTASTPSTRWSATILGTYQGQQVPHAAIWKPDGTVIDLNNLPGANPDLVLGDALAINDNGDIVGLAGQISTQTEVGFLLPAGYVVDSILDDPDKTPGDGNCATAAGTCTLRAAIQEVNAAKVHRDRRRSPSRCPAATGRSSPRSALPAVQYPVDDRRPRQGRAARHERRAATPTG